MKITIKKEDIIYIVDSKNKSLKCITTKKDLKKSFDNLKELKRGLRWDLN